MADANLDTLTKMVGDANPVRPLLMKTRPTVVELVQVTADNLPAVAAWCGGRILRHLHSDSLGIYNPASDTFITCRPGDWVVKDAYGNYDRVPDADLYGRFDRLVS